MKTYSIRTLLLVTAIAAGIFALVIPAIQAARNSAMEMECSNNLKQISLGLLNYESTYNRFPIAMEISQDGRLWRSWRSRVYPTFMEQFPQIYDETSAWDSQVNLRLINGTPMTIAAGKEGGTVTRTFDRVPRCFACPKCKKANGVNYVVITGEGTAFPRSAATKLSDITDGLENTILVVESVNCTPDWTEPRDLDIESMDFAINSLKGPSISSWHPTGALVCFADMQVYCVTPRITAVELRALITINGGENVKRDALVSRGVLVKR
jgi:Protein of unknown function (DUF1559)